MTLTFRLSPSQWRADHGECLDPRSNNKNKLVVSYG